MPPCAPNEYGPVLTAASVRQMVSFVATVERSEAAAEAARLTEMVLRAIAEGRCKDAEACAYEAVKVFDYVGVE